jgi:hypothetical protein
MLWNRIIQVKIQRDGTRATVCRIPYLTALTARTVGALGEAAAEPPCAFDIVKFTPFPYQLIS